MVFLLYFVWVLIFGLACSYPPIALLLYGTLASDRDAFGISQFLNTFSSYNKTSMRALFIVAFIVAIIKLIPRIVNRPISVVWSSSLISMILCFVIFAGSFIKGYSIIESLSFLVYSGVPVFLIWILTETKKYYRHLFLLFVSFQIIVASLTIGSQSLEFIDGKTYQSEEYSVDSTGSHINLNLPGSTLNKGSVGKHGQFHNPNALGFYSCISIVIGTFLFFSSKGVSFSRFWGFSLVALGIFCWLNSLSRGPAVAVLLFLFLWEFVYPFLDKFRDGGYSRLMRCILFFVVLMFIAYVALDFVGFLVPEASNVSVSTRLAGYYNGWEAIKRYPLFGVGPGWEWASGINPHFLPLSFAAEYGVLSGVLVTIVVYLIGLYAIFKSMARVYDSSISPSKAAYTTGLILVVLGIATTNNITATVLFWVCLAESYVSINS